MAEKDKKFYWLKLKSEFMSGEIVDFLMSQKNGANYVVLYQMLVLKTMNTQGRLCSTIGEILIPFDAEKIQRECKWFDIDTIVVALELYSRLGLVYKNEEGVLQIADFENIVGSETYWAQRKRIQRKEEDGQSLDNVQQTLISNISNNNNIYNIKEEVIIEENKNRINYQEIVDMYNKICSSFPKCTTLSDSRKKAIKARLNSYTIDDFRKMFEKAEASSFLKGNNNRNWSANFDWLLKDTNFAKVIEGTYNREQPKQNNSQTNYKEEDIRRYRR